MSIQTATGSFSGTANVNVAPGAVRSDSASVSGSASALLTPSYPQVYTPDGRAGWVGTGPATPNLLSEQQAGIEGPQLSAPDFKTGIGNGGGISVDTTTSWQGAGSLKCYVPVAATFQSVSVNLAASKFQPGQTYVFSGYMRVASGTGSLRFYCQANDLIAGNTSIGTVTTYSVGTAWTRFSVAVTMPLDLSPFSIIGLRADTGGTAQALTWYMDGLQIERNTTVSPWQPGQPNVTIPNATVTLAAAPDAKGTIA